MIFNHMDQYIIYTYLFGNIKRMVGKMKLKIYKSMRNTMNTQQLLTLFTYCHLGNMTQSNYINWPTMYGVTNYDIVTRIYTEIVVLILRRGN